MSTTLAATCVIDRKSPTMRPYGLPFPVFLAHASLNGDDRVLLRAGVCRRRTTTGRLRLSSSCSPPCLLLRNPREGERKKKTKGNDAAREEFLAPVPYGGGTVGGSPAVSAARKHASQHAVVLLRAKSLVSSVGFSCVCCKWPHVPYREHQVSRPRQTHSAVDSRPGRRATSPSHERRARAGLGAHPAAVSVSSTCSTSLCRVLGIRRGPDMPRQRQPLRPHRAATHQHPPALPPSHVARARRARDGRRPARQAAALCHRTWHPGQAGARWPPGPLPALCSTPIDSLVGRSTVCTVP